MYKYIESVRKYGKTPKGKARTKRYRLSEKGRAKYKRNAKAAYDRRMELIVELKQRPCMDCGVQYPPFVMDWHHRNPHEKEFNISTIRTAWQKILIEIEKCDLLCANCHRIREHGPSN